jgi:rod shape-determining protein MreD
MIGIVAVGATAVVAMVLQSTVFARLLPLTGVIPNLMLVLVVVLGVRHQTVYGVGSAFALGYVLDTFVGTTLGLHALAFTIVYAVVAVMAQTVRVDRGAAGVLAVVVAGCVHALVVAGVSRLAHGGPPLGEALRHGIVEALITAALSPAVLAFVEWQERLLGAEAR